MLQNKALKNDSVQTCTLNWFSYIYQNVSYANLSKNLEIIISEYGPLKVDDENVKMILICIKNESQIFQKH